MKIVKTDAQLKAESAELAAQKQAFDKAADACDRMLHPIHAIAENIKSKLGKE